MQPKRYAQPFGSEPQPNAASRARLGKTGKDPGDRGLDGFIGMEPDFALGLAPD